MQSIAQYLLEIKAVRLSPEAPFTWASGMKSPIYCDNRVTLSYPEARTAIRDGFKDLVAREFPKANAVAGVATAGIAHGALLADVLGLPFIYVRSKPKSHGMENLIEGRLDPKLNYIVIEDVVSTGNSSLMAVEGVRNAGGKVAGLACIFTYGFQTAYDNFSGADVKWASLTNFETLLEKAVEINYLQAAELDSLKAWRNNPEGWASKSAAK